MQRRQGWSQRKLAACRGRLEQFAEDVFASLARQDQRARGLAYVRGLLLAGKRKSCEPMAARLGDVHPQALHHFLQASPWDWEPVRRRLAELACQALDPGAWIVDDTGFPKDGAGSAGVARQYSGTLGKVANCQVGVSVSAGGERGSAPVTGSCSCPSPGMATPSGARPPTFPTSSTTSPSGSLPWRCWTSCTPGGCLRCR